MDHIKKKNNGLVFGFLLLNLFIFSSSFESILNIPKILKYIFSVLALSYFFSFYRKSDKVKFYSTFVYLTTYLFLFVSIFLLVRSLRFDLFYIQEILGERFYFLPYLLPLLFLFVSYDLYFFKRLLYFSYILIPIAIFVMIFIIAFKLDFSNYVYIVTGISTLSLAPGILLIVSHLYKKSKYTLLSSGFFIFLIFILATLGRRGETIEILFLFFWAFVVRFSSGGLSKLKKMILLFFSIFFISISTFFINKNVESIPLFERGISTEGFAESRGETIILFLNQFGSLPNDYFIGRGLDGTFQKFFTGDNKMSRSIEIGYFNVLLKGGFLYLLPMMTLFIIAFYNGYFKSKNDLSKALSGIVLWQIIYMVSFGMANYATNYLLLWISVAACLDYRIRNTSNFQLKKLFNQ